MLRIDFGGNYKIVFYNQYDYEENPKSMLKNIFFLLLFLMLIFMLLFSYLPSFKIYQRSIILLLCSLLFQLQNKVHITWEWNKVELISKILYTCILCFQHFFPPRMHDFDVPCFCIMHTFACFLEEWKFYFSRDEWKWFC